MWWWNQKLFMRKCWWWAFRFDSVKRTIHILSPCEGGRMLRLFRSCCEEECLSPTPRCQFPDHFLIRRKQLLVLIRWSLFHCGRYFARLSVELAAFKRIQPEIRRVSVPFNKSFTAQLDIYIKKRKRQCSNADFNLRKSYLTRLYIGI